MCFDGHMKHHDELRIRHNKWWIQHNLVVESQIKYFNPLAKKISCSFLEKIDAQQSILISPFLQLKSRESVKLPSLSFPMPAQQRLLSMKVTSNTRPRTIKQKKESLINSRTSNSSVFATPYKELDVETPVKVPQYHTAGSLKFHKAHALQVTLSAQKSERSLKLSQPADISSNPLRRIKSIKDLTSLHQSYLVSKSRYRFKVDCNLSNSGRSVDESGKKHFNDKIPINILAVQQGIAQKPKTQSRQKSFSSKFSQAKVIKSLIMQNRQMS